MTLEEAQKILESAYGDVPGGYWAYRRGGTETICLDGEFTRQQIEAMLVLMMADRPTGKS
jgi:hypothetical protein